MKSSCRRQCPTQAVSVGSAPELKPRQSVSARMFHTFDFQSYSGLLSDAERLRDLASSLERRLAHLVGDAKSSSDDRQSRQVEDLREAHAASEEQAQLMDTMLRRLIVPIEKDVRNHPVVLVVDDSQDARDATALLLDQSGFRAITAANGLEALVIAHYAHPVVALLDLMMPILDGLQTARILSESPATRDVRVIAYSGRADMFSRRLPGTFTAILAKPTTPEELLTMVQAQAGFSGEDGTAT